MTFFLIDPSNFQSNQIGFWSFNNPGILGEKFTPGEEKDQLKFIKTLRIFFFSKPELETLTVKKLWKNLLIVSFIWLTERDKINGEICCQQRIQFFSLLFKKLKPRKNKYDNMYGVIRRLFLGVFKRTYTIFIDNWYLHY